MVGRIAGSIGVTSLRYQKLDDMVNAIGLDREKVCTYCWNGCDNRSACTAHGEEKQTTAASS
jgi:amidophosphoribosyltransferase